MKLFNHSQTRTNRRLITTTLISFLLYNVAIGVVGSIIFFYGIPSDLRDKFILEQREKIDLKRIPFNFISGKVSSPDKFYLEIKHKHLQRLAYFRSRSLERGVLYTTAENKVPAVLRFKDQVYRVSLGLKGRLQDHWRDEEIWSLKVEVKDGKSILGMKEFALQHPGTRSFIDEWILHELFKSAGLVSLRYDFVSVDINGNGHNIYALEEGFDKRLIENNRLKEGPIFKFDRDFYWEGGLKVSRKHGTPPHWQNKIGLEQSFWGSNLVPMPYNKTIADSTQFKLFLKAGYLIDQFRKSQLHASEVFDLEKLAKFFALLELFGHHHASYMDNIRFYYNPITSRIEPIIHDNSDLKLLPESPLMGSGMQIGTSVKSAPPVDFFGSWTVTAWHESIFKDPIFFREYIRNLELISAKEFLDSFFTMHQDQFISKQRILHRDYPLYHFNSEQVLYRNQDYIRNTLEADHLLEVDYSMLGSAEKVLHLDIVNTHCFPIEVLSVTFNDSTPVKLFPEPILVQANDRVSEEITHQLTVPITGDFVLIDSLRPEVELQVRILGSDKRKSVRANFKSSRNESHDFNLDSKSNFGDFDFITVSDQHKLLEIKGGSHILNKSLCIPKGYRLAIHGPTTITMNKGAGIVSASPVFFEGNRANPVVFIASDTLSNGIVIRDTREESIMRYVHFYNFSSTVDSESKASIAFERAPVAFEHCLFSSNNHAASYLSIHHTTFKIDRTTFLNSDQSALLVDFSIGSMSNSKFFSSGMDAIRITHGRVTMDNIEIEHAEGCGIDVSSSSNVLGKNLKVRNAEVAFSSSLQSSLKIDNVEISDCKIGCMAFLNEYDWRPPNIELRQKPRFNGDVPFPYLVEQGGEIRSGMQSIHTDTDGKMAKEILATARSRKTTLIELK